MTSQITGNSIVCWTVCFGIQRIKYRSDRWFSSQGASKYGNVSMSWRHHEFPTQMSVIATNGAELWYQNVIFGVSRQICHLLRNISTHRLGLIIRPLYNRPCQDMQLNNLQTSHWRHIEFLQTSFSWNNTGWRRSIFSCKIIPFRTSPCQRIFLKHLYWFLWISKAAHA